MIFSFIIVNYRSADLLSDWFTSLPNTGLLPDEYEVIIVNNDTNEKEKLDTLQAQYGFKLIHAESNLGFGSACNRGAKESSGEIIGFINPDTRFVSGDLHRVSNRFRNDSTLGIIGLRLTTRDGATQAWSAGIETSLWDILRNNLGFPKSRSLWESTEPIEVDWVSGASLFIPKNLFQEIQGFDEDFFLYFEDADLCKRLRQAEKKVLYFPGISLIHISGGSSSSNRSQKKHYYASQDLYFSKHRPKWEGLGVKTLRNVFVK